MINLILLGYLLVGFSLGTLFCYSANKEDKARLWGEKNPITPAIGVAFTLAWPLVLPIFTLMHFFERIGNGKDK